MTLDEAIEITAEIREPLKSHSNPKFKNALSLDIEALKEVKEARFMDNRLGHTLLPGETEEVTK